MRASPNSTIEPQQKIKKLNEDLLAINLMNMEVTSNTKSAKDKVFNVNLSNQHLATS